MSLKGKEVLVVDDTPDVRYLCRKIVENAGMIVTEADSVDAALTILSQKAPHLILLDVRMPGKSGLDLLVEKAHMPRLKSIPVMVVSSVSDRESIFKAIGLGAANYVLKPFTTAILMQKIRKVLREADFQSYAFPRENAPALKASVSAQISNPTKTQLFVESPLKLGGKTRVSLASEQLFSAGLEDCVFVTDAAQGVRATNGFYVSKLHAMGASGSLTRLLKKTRTG